MAESHVVSGLVAKHAELAGLIQFHRIEIERVASDLKHLNATLKLFDPEIDLCAVSAQNESILPVQAASSALRAARAIPGCWISLERQNSP